MDRLAEVLCGEEAVAGSDLRRRALQAATALSELGIERGDTVALLMRNDLALLESLLALQYVGAYAVPINWHSKPAEIAYVASDCGAKLLIAHTDLLSPVRGQLPPKMQLVGVETPQHIARAYRVSAEQCGMPRDIWSWHTLLERSAPTSVPPAEPTDSVIYTSGTSGNPKGVRRLAASPEQRAATERMRATVFGIGAGARTLVTAPLYHTAPNYFALRGLHRGELLVLPSRLNPEQLLEAIERHRITHLYAVPTLFVRLLGLPKAVRSRHDLSSLRCVLHAGGPCAATTKRAMIEWWGPVINEYYGSTEIGPITFVTSEEWLRKPGTVGRAVDGVQLRIQDENGQAAPPGIVGEIFARNSGYPDFEYLHREHHTDTVHAGALLASGDLGYVDEDGYLFISDRKSDMVISGGVNIYPAEIESVLLQMPEIVDCAVFGIPDEEFGEAVMAIVQPREGCTLGTDSIRAHLAARLASFKLPRHIDVRSDLPREESGKIKKRLLREPYWKLAGRSI